MARTVFDLQVDIANIERQIAEKKNEIQMLACRLTEFEVEYKRAMESLSIRNRDEAIKKSELEEQEQENK